jgi:hypothetical protein
MPNLSLPDRLPGKEAMFASENERPDPDALLARLQDEERRARRGKLRI